MELSPRCNDEGHGRREKGIYGRIPFEQTFRGGGSKPDPPYVLVLRNTVNGRVRLVCLVEAPLPDVVE